MIAPCPRCGRRRIRDRDGVLHALCGTCRRADDKATELARVRDGMRRLRAARKRRRAKPSPVPRPLSRVGLVKAIITTHVDELRNPSAN